MNRRWNNLSRLAVVLAAIGWFTGCRALRFSEGEQVNGPDYIPKNIYGLTSELPEKIRRVAVLPLVPGAPGSQTEAGAEAMQAVLVSELSRAGAFEIVVVSEDDLRHATGRGSWTAEEKLPATLLARLRERHGCDAVLFSRLNHFRAYPPLSVGWSFKLVECPAKASETPRIFWAADEMFDAGNPAVVNSARRYYLSSLKETGPLADSESMLVSPRRFAQYTLHALALTLPVRDLLTQVSAPAADVSDKKKSKPLKPVTEGSK